MTICNNIKCPYNESKICSKSFTTINEFGGCCYVLTTDGRAVVDAYHPTEELYKRDVSIISVTSYEECSGDTDNEEEWEQLTFDAIK